jgi:hypothetical protein
VWCGVDYDCLLVCVNCVCGFYYGLCLTAINLLIRYWSLSWVRFVVDKHRFDRGMFLFACLCGFVYVLFWTAVILRIR